MYSRHTFPNYDRFASEGPEPNGLDTLHGTGSGTATGTGNDGFLFYSLSTVHTTQAQGTIVSYCASPVQSVCTITAGS